MNGGVGSAVGGFVSAETFWIFLIFRISYVASVVSGGFWADLADLAPPARAPCAVWWGWTRAERDLAQWRRSYVRVRVRKCESLTSCGAAVARPIGA